MAIDAGHVYWTRGGGPFPDAIGRANLDAHGNVSDVNQGFITAGVDPEGMAVDAGHVY